MCRGARPVAREYPPLVVLAKYEYSIVADQLQTNVSKVLFHLARTSQARQINQNKNWILRVKYVK